MSELRVGPEAFRTPGRDIREACHIHDSFTRLAHGEAGPVLAEMAREVLAGETEPHEAVRMPVYAEALREEVVAAREAWDRSGASEALLPELAYAG